MKPNYEEIIRALQCCTSSEKSADCPFNCPFGDMSCCEQNLMYHALALIRELTAEKERIAHESECHRQTVIDNLQRSLEYLNEETERVRADTVRKMQERVKRKIELLEYSVNIQQKTVSVDTLLKQGNWLLHEVVPDAINKIAKELLEEAIWRGGEQK